MKLAIVLTVVVLMFSVAFISYAADTENPNWKYVGEEDIFKHTHEYDELEAPWGAGLDLDLYDNDYVTVAAEGRWDFNNKLGSTYVVTKPKIVVWDLVTGLFR